MFFSIFFQDGKGFFPWYLIAQTFVAWRVMEPKLAAWRGTEHRNMTRDLLI